MGWSKKGSDILDALGEEGRGAPILSGGKGLVIRENGPDGITATPSWRWGAAADFSNGVGRSPVRLLARGATSPHGNGGGRAEHEAQAVREHDPEGCLGAIEGAASHGDYATRLIAPTSESQSATRRGPTRI
jgi:hypothetical protein